MKKVLFLLVAPLLFLCVSTPIQAKVKSPDFAYPQTVSKDAKADLAKAEKDHDAHAALNALIRIYIGDMLVDQASLQNSAKLVENTSSKFKGSPLLSLFYGLEAKIVADMYAGKRWAYDLRRLPLDPLPNDYTEWSGEQFKRKIKELCDTSISLSSAMTDLNMADYEDIITSNELTRIYFPTLLDFAYENVANLYNTINLPSLQIYKDALNVQSDKNSASAIQWLTRIKQDEKFNFDNFKILYATYSDNQYAALLLTNLYNNIISYDTSKEKVVVADQEEYNQEKPSVDFEMNKRWLIQQIDTFLSKFPNAPLADNLRDKKQRILAQNIEFQSPNYASRNMPIEVKCTSTNATSAILRVYQLPNNFYENTMFTKRKLVEYCKAIKPVKEYDVSFPYEAPFKADTTISISIPSYGYFILMPSIPGKESDNINMSLINSVPAMPITTIADAKTYAIVASSSDGAGIKDAKVVLSGNKKQIGTAISDAKGIATFSNDSLKSYSDIINLVIDGQTYTFDQYLHYSSNRRTIDEKSASVLTDRSIYHPGETINVLVVASEINTADKNVTTENLLRNKEIKVMLFDANYIGVDTISGVTDDFGRLACKLDIPKKGLTGTFSIRADYEKRSIGNTSVVVSDYKMPDFEVKISSILKNRPNKGYVTIWGKALTYSGMPVQNAEVDVTVYKHTYAFRNFYSIYPSQEEIFTVSIYTDSDGKFSLNLHPTIFGNIKEYSHFTANFDVTSSTGSKASGSVNFNLGKQYMIALNCPNNVNALKPFAVDASSIGPEGEIADLPLKWELSLDKKVVAKGDLYDDIDLSKITPGTYKLTVSAIDEYLASPASAIINIYNEKTKIVPTNHNLWIENSTYNISSDSKTIDILYGVTNDNTNIFYTLSEKDILYEIDSKTVDKGYHHLHIDLPASITNGKLKIFTLRNCIVEEANIAINRIDDNKAKITCETFRDRLTPSTEETWKFKVIDTENVGSQFALVLDMYNKALDSLNPHFISLNFPRKNNIFAYWNLIVNYPMYNINYSNFTAKNIDIKFKSLDYPQFNFYDIIVQNLSNYALGRSYKRSLASGAVVTEEMASMDAVMVTGNVYSAAEKEESEEEALTKESKIHKSTPQPDTFEYRDAEVPLAIWEPMLTTDEDGNLCYTFTVPNANTTWTLQALAWNQDMATASLSRDFIASKPVMVQPNAPRFLRTGDIAEISAAIFNNSNAKKAVSTTFEIFEPISCKVLETKHFESEIAANSTATVSISVSAPVDATSIGYRVKSSNGTFTDGEQGMIPVLPSQASLIETQPFYLNPGDKTFEANIPDKKIAKITLTFSENPAWSIVSALPGLRKNVTEGNANSAAAALYSTAIAQRLINDNPHVAEALKYWNENPSDSMLLSMLNKNEELKQVVLNSTPWVQAAMSDTERMANLSLIFSTNDCEKAIGESIDALKKLQKPDGGWAWGSWCEESSVWITSNVLSMLSDILTDTKGYALSNTEISALKEMTKKALKFWDSKVKDIDMLYTVIRPRYTSVAISSNGKKVIDKTLRNIRKNWKSYTDPADKSIAAMALYANGNKSMARTIMSSVSQFGVWTESQGLKFPSVSSLTAYSILLEAYSQISPKSKEVNGLRQQLIVRKQGTDWGNAIVTTQVVKAILSSGTRYTIPAKGASVYAGETSIAPATEIEKYTGSFKADLTSFAGKTLRITSPGQGPAYGAIYTQYTENMYDVKSSSCPDLSIEKNIAVRNGTEWIEAPDTLKVGDYVKVTLTIKTKRNMQYVTVIDERPAAFEPVDQLPSWIWSDNAGFYRENRNASTNLFISYLRPGTYQLSYDMYVSHPGSFSSGVATAQSQYAPELSAHSAGRKITVKNQK